MILEGGSIPCANGTYGEKSAIIFDCLEKSSHSGWIQSIGQFVVRIRYNVGNTVGFRIWLQGNTSSSGQWNFSVFGIISAGQLAIRPIFSLERPRTAYHGLVLRCYTIHPSSWALLSLCSLRRLRVDGLA